MLVFFVVFDVLSCKCYCIQRRIFFFITNLQFRGWDEKYLSFLCAYLELTLYKPFNLVEATKLKSQLKLTRLRPGESLCNWSSHALVAKGALWLVGLQTNQQTNKGPVAVNNETITEMIDSLCLTLMLFIARVFSLKIYISHNPLCAPSLFYSVASFLKRMSTRTFLALFVLKVKQTRTSPFKSMAQAHNVMQSGGCLKCQSSQQWSPSWLIAVMF